MDEVIKEQVLPYWGSGRPLSGRLAWSPQEGPWGPASPGASLQLRELRLREGSTSLRGAQNSGLGHFLPTLTSPSFPVACFPSLSGVSAVFKNPFPPPSSLLPFFTSSTFGLRTQVGQKCCGYYIVVAVPYLSIWGRPGSVFLFFQCQDVNFHLLNIK